MRLAIGILWAALAWAAGPSPVPLRIPMRDGIRLAANLYLPSSNNRYPIILIRTPYGQPPSGLSQNQQRIVEHGFGLVIQSVRGRHASEGRFEPMRQEVADADDTLNWLARQPWSNGRIGMMGGSYLGITQWKAALTGNPHLQAIFPVVSGGDDYRDRYYSPGGAMKLGHRLSWMASNVRIPGYMVPPFDNYVRTLPVAEADRAATCQRVDWFQEVLRHPDYDAYWKEISILEQVDKVKVPVFAVGGWYDNYVESDLALFAALRSLGRQAHLLIGPWAHNMSTPLPAVDFGRDASAPIIRYQVDWFSRWLKDDRQKGKFAPLRIFVMGINQWRDEIEWPLQRAVNTPYYLTESGRLSLRPPLKASTERYRYDPSNPVPTRGGNVCCSHAIFPWGPMDQAPIETRPDILVFSSDALREDMEVTGPVRADLDVSTSVRDTDFTVKLVDVYPDGKAINLCDGILRLRYREGLSRAKLAEPGKRYRISVPVGVTSNVFRTGHRIRIEISSSNFPRFDRNRNTGALQAWERKSQVADQAVYLKDSYILLPVVR